MKNVLRFWAALPALALLMAWVSFAQTGGKELYCPMDDKKIDKEPVAVKYEGETYYVHNEKEKKKFEKNPEKYAFAWDPVCEMKVGKNDTAGGHRTRETVEYKGQRYYFCAKGEREKFLAEPEKYRKKMKKI